MRSKQANDYDDEANEVKSDDENDSSDSEEEIPDESERKVSPMMPIISPVTA